MSKPKKAVNSPMGQSISPQRQNPIYPKPTVPVALGEFLSPKQVTAAGLEVVVTYPSIKPGDVIALKFNGDDTFVPIEVENQTSVSFWVSVPHIIKALGTTVDIQYTLSGESAGQKSDILQLTVLPFMEGDLEMAKITEASPPTPGVLDLRSFDNDAEVTIAPWPLISPGQTVWLDLEHDAQGDESYKIINGDPVTEAETSAGITRYIDRDELKKIPHESLITLPLRVNFNGAVNEAGTVPFSTLELVVLQAEEGDFIELFENVPTGPVISPLDTKCLIFTTESGAAMDMYSSSGGTKTLKPPLSPGTKLSIDVKSEYIFNRIIFGVGHGAEKANVRCYYGNGLEYRDYTISAGGSNYTFQHENIRKFEITLTGNINRYIHVWGFYLYED